MTQHLCTTCNFCCDGSLFDCVTVTPEERDRLGGGPDFEMARGELTMRQACVRQGADGFCTAYDIRPSKCRQFECALLKSHEAGQISRGDADAIVAQTKQVRAAALQAQEACLEGHFSPPGPKTIRRLSVAVEAASDMGAALDADLLASARQRYDDFTQAVRAHFKKTP